MSDPLYREPTFNRALGSVEATSLVTGTALGAALLLAPAIVAGSVGQLGLAPILLLWLAGGLVSLAGAACVAELAGMMPQTGGQYVYLREAFGPLPAFLFGWMEFWVSRPAQIALAGAVFAEYAGPFTHFQSPDDLRWTAFLVVFVLTVINYLGVRWGGAVQVLFTSTKVGGLLAFVACAFFLPGGTTENWSTTVPSSSEVRFDAALWAAIVAVLWAYDGWASGAAVAEEMKDPQRDVPRGLIWGVTLLTLLFLVVNVAYHYVLPAEQIAASPQPASDVAMALFGDVGLGLAATLIMVACFGRINGLLLTGSRISYAMARDDRFFWEVRQLHPSFRTPYLGVLFQGLWAGVLVLLPFNSFANRAFGWHMSAPYVQQLATCIVFAMWTFYALTGLAVIVLRRRDPDRERPYRVPSYPAIPLLFTVASVAIVVAALIQQPVECLMGAGLLLIGIPAYGAWERARRELTGEDPQVVQ
jgi:APA family basic amino acid/polyamine antiporter